MRNKYTDVRKFAAKHPPPQFPGVLAAKQLQHCRPCFGTSAKLTVTNLVVMLTLQF